MKMLVLTLALILTGMLRCKAQQRTFVLATYTYATNNRLQNIEPLASYLSKKTRYSIRAISYPTVASLIQAIQNDSVDLAMINTSGYLLLQRNHLGLVQPLVNLDLGNRFSTNYGGCLIAARDLGVSSIEAVQNNKRRYTLAMVNPSSTSGNLVPRLLLNSKAIPDADAVFNLRYTGTHRKAVEDVLNGQADLAGCSCSEIDSARKHASFDKKAIVLDSFNNIPLGPIVFNKRSDAKLAKMITRQLLKLHLESPAVLTQFCNGWTEFKQAKRFKKVSDKEYDAFRALFGNNLRLWKLIE